MYSSKEYLFDIFGIEKEENFFVILFDIIAD